MLYVSGQRLTLAHAQVNSQAPMLTDLPVPRRYMDKGGVQTGPVKRTSTRCYTAALPPHPKGCIYPDPHPVDESCVCSQDGGEIPGTFLQ